MDELDGVKEDLQKVASKLPCKTFFPLQLWNQQKRTFEVSQFNIFKKLTIANKLSLYKKNTLFAGVSFQTHSVWQLFAQHQFNEQEWLIN